MTEEAYQCYRKLMAAANGLRGMIAKRRGDVAKWTAIEDAHRRELREGQANGAKKMLEKAILNLEKAKLKFTALTFPDCNMKATKQQTATCDLCGAAIKEGDTYCTDCLN